MDLNKTEKLKEVLNQTLSSEDIQKKLKEEMKNNALKKKSEAREEKIENEAIEKKDLFNEVDNKEVLEKKVSKKEKDDRTINLLLYFVGVVALLLFVVVIYLFVKDDEIMKPKEVIKNSKIEKESFFKLNKENFKIFYNSRTMNTLKCYNFKEGDVFLNIQCQKKLKEFLKNNKDALRFEVIPVLSINDNKIYTKMESNLKDMKKDFKDIVKEYMLRGLSRERVLEASKYIKDNLGENTILTPTNYYVKSKKDNKGIIVNAYH